MGVTDTIEQINFIKIIEICIPVLTSLFICFITIYVTNKQQKKNLKQQIKQHQEAMKLSEKKYEEELSINEETERLKHLPYLSLFPKEQIHKFAGKMERFDNNVISIPFELINEGMGIAFSVHLKYLEKSESIKNIRDISVALKSNCCDGYDILGVREPIDTDVLSIKNQTNFCLYLSAVDKMSKRINPSNAIRWEFEIGFFDIQGRNYLQSYSFFTSTDNDQILRINSHMPKLVI